MRSARSRPHRTSDIARRAGSGKATLYLYFETKEQIFRAVAGAAVFAIEASRLARNGRDWHTLIEFCGLVGTVIVDEDGIYDPRDGPPVFDPRGSLTLDFMGIGVC